MAKSEEELKSLLMKVKGESEKAGLKLNIQWIMASIPIISWHIDGETMETVTDWLHHKIKRRLLLGWKAMTNLDSC